MNLIAKLTLCISAVLLLVMVPFSYLNVQAMKRLLHEEAVSAADNVSETIIKTTYYQMLENDRERVYQMIQEAEKQEGIEHIRMLTKEGRIVFSTNPDEVGAFFDKTASACDMCHSGTRPRKHVSSMGRSRVFRDASGEDVLGITKAIYNQESCYTASCHVHRQDQDILGVLDTVVSLKRMRVQTAQYTRRLVVLALAMLLVIAASLTLLVQKFVHRPITVMLDHTKRVARLNLSSTLALRSRDEIGELAGAFNDMTASLKTATDQLEEWARTLEVKVEERTRELQRIQAQLLRSEKLASLGELVAGIAHELNNPLTGILVLSSLMEKNRGLDPALKDDMRTVVYEAHRCASIVKGLLDFARKSVPEKCRASVNQVMENTLTLIGNESFFHDVKIETHYNETVPEVLIDPNQIEQVFINILLNAAQAMPEGGKLLIETDLAGPHIAVRIQDTGRGIHPDDLSRIFDPFFTTKEGKGTGLGLSVSYGIVENHGGKIEVASQVGVGTSFTILLPVSGGGAAAQASLDVA